MEQLDDFYLTMITPPELVHGMTYDEFCDWVEMGTKDFIEDAIIEFNKFCMDDHVNVMKIILQRKTYKSLDI